MATHPTHARPRLFLGDHPRLEIPLDSGGPLPAWLTVALPGPMAEDRPEGRFLADPRIPESEVLFEWSRASAGARTLSVLTVTAGGRTWTLEQDVRHPSRWIFLTDPDARRHWY